MRTNVKCFCRRMQHTPRILSTHITTWTQPSTTRFVSQAAHPKQTSTQHAAPGQACSDIQKDLSRGTMTAVVGGKHGTRSKRICQIAHSRRQACSNIQRDLSDGTQVLKAKAAGERRGTMGLVQHYVRPGVRDVLLDAPEELSVRPACTASSPHPQQFTFITPQGARGHS